MENKHIKQEKLKKLVAERRRKLKKLVVEYMGGECVRCGWKEHQCGLVPHHVDPIQKEFGISAMGKTIKWETLKKECNKCILLCMNCHNVVHTLKEEYYFNIDNIPKYDDLIDPDAFKKRIQKFCKDCNIEINYGSTRCVSCNGRINALASKRNKITWPSYESLVEQLKEKSYLQLSKELGVSDNAIRKHIRIIEKYK